MMSLFFFTIQREVREIFQIRYIESIVSFIESFVRHFKALFLSLVKTII